MNQATTQQPHTEHLASNGLLRVVRQPPTEDDPAIYEVQHRYTVDDDYTVVSESPDLSAILEAFGACNQMIRLFNADPRG